MGKRNCRKGIIWNFKGDEEDFSFVLKSVGEGELLPLIRFGESPHKKMDACYFYSRKENNEQRWISYHNENQPTRLFNIPEVNNFLNQLRDPSWLRF